MDSYPCSGVLHRNIIALPLPPTLLEDDFVQYSYSNSMRQKPRDHWLAHASPFISPPQLMSLAPKKALCGLCPRPVLLPEPPADLTTSRVFVSLKSLAGWPDERVVDLLLTILDFLFQMHIPKVIFKEHHPSCFVVDRA